MVPPDENPGLNDIKHSSVHFVAPNPPRGSSPERLGWVLPVSVQSQGLIQVREGGSETLPGLDSGLRDAALPVTELP